MMAKMIFHASPNLFNPHHFNCLSHFGTLRASWDRIQSYNEECYLYGGYSIAEHSLLIEDYGNEMESFIHDLKAQKIITNDAYYRMRDLDHSEQMEAIAQSLESETDALHYVNSSEDMGEISHILLRPKFFIPGIKTIKFSPSDLNFEEFADLVDQKITYIQD